MTKKLMLLAASFCISNSYAVVIGSVPGIEELTSASDPIVATFCVKPVESKPSPNRSYVQSGPDGITYARCIPSELQGRKGTTTIYRVWSDKDEILDVYDWYSPQGLVLGWSPIAGKVAVMSLRGLRTSDLQKQIELSFYLGGKFLISYSTKDLANMGVGTYSGVDGIWADFKPLGCEQIPGTNDYGFVIEARNRRIRFDILTGKLSENSLK